MPTPMMYSTLSVGPAAMGDTTKGSPGGGRVLKEQVIPQRKNGHLANMPDARLFMSLCQRNAPEWCVSLRYPKRWERGVSSALPIGIYLTIYPLQAHIIGSKHTINIIIAINRNHFPLTNGSFLYKTTFSITRFEAMFLTSTRPFNRSISVFSNINRTTSFKASVVIPIFQYSGLTLYPISPILAFWISNTAIMPTTLLDSFNTIPQSKSGEGFLFTQGRGSMNINSGFFSLLLAFLPQYV